MAASSAPKDPTDELQEEEVPDFPDDGGVAADGPPATDSEEILEELLEPLDRADDLRLLTSDGPPSAGRGVQGKYVYSYTFTHPGPQSIARGLCAPSDISKSETMDRVQKAYAACGIDLRETAVFREPHKNGKPHDAVLCSSLTRHKWIPIVTYLYETWNMRMGASKHIKTWSDGCRYFRTSQGGPEQEKLKKYINVYCFS